MEDALGAVVGWVAFPVVLLVGWVLVRSGQRHHEAEIKRRPRERPSPPPAVVRYGLLGLFGVLALSQSMIPAALGVWLGSVAGGDSGAVPTVLPALGGVLGLALPFEMSRQARLTQAGKNHRWSSLPEKNDLQRAMRRKGALPPRTARSTDTSAVLQALPGSLVR